MNNYAHIFDLLTRLRQVNDNFLEKTILVVCYHFKSVLISLIKKKKSINFRALLCCFVSILPVYLQLIFIIYQKKVCIQWTNILREDHALIMCTLD